MPTAEIVSIGTELLTGATVNSNATFISRKLHDLGFEVMRHTAIPDDKELIIETLAESLASAPLVIVTGGLGPTLDDLTREAVAELLEAPLEFNEELAKNLLARFGEVDALKNQATIPKRALILPNYNGSASGLIFLHHQSFLVVLPGVPLEMEALMVNYVIPYLERMFSLSPHTRTRLHFFNLFEASVDPYLKKLHGQFPDLKIGIYPSHGLLSVSLEGSSREVSIAQEELLKQFEEHHYESSDGTIEMAIQELFIKKGWTLSLAESCTGGAIAARLTQHSGSSQYFLGSLVAYSNALKEQMLEISPLLIQEKGAVSQEVALAMAHGIQKKTLSTFALSVTGIAGPLGGTQEKPVGTIFCAINSDIFPLEAKGNRKTIIEICVNFILGHLYYIAKNKKD